MNVETCSTFPLLLQCTGWLSMNTVQDGGSSLEITRDPTMQLAVSSIPMVALMENPCTIFQVDYVGAPLTAALYRATYVYIMMNQCKYHYIR